MQGTAIEKVLASGLFSASEDSHFSWHGCDVCADGQGNTVYDAEGYESLDSAREPRENLVEFAICGECLDRAVNG